jgi:hypothetical protein
MNIRQVVVCGAVAIGAVVAIRAADPQASQARQRTVPVLVLGKGDVPVPSLGEQDFSVREDGAVREIVRVAPAAPPTHIVLLIDDSQAASQALRELRTTLNTFINTMADQTPAPAVRLTTFGDRPTVITDFSTSFSAVSRGIERIQPRQGAGATFLEGVLDTCRDLGKLKIRGATIVAFVAESGPEFSNVQSKNVADALRGAQASLWTVTLQGRGIGDNDLSSPEARERARVIGDVTGESGGRNEVALSVQSLPQAFEKVATQLLSRYDVTYGRPERLIPPSRLEITARDRSWKVQVSRWPGE